MAERVFLSGPMGSGKSHVAEALSELWSTPALDLDARIEQRAGAAVSAIFEQRGEAAFRALEREVLDEALRSGAKIIALGGGTVTQTELRRRLLREGTLITLRASLATLRQRVGSGQGRPLLAGQDVEARLSTLLAERAGAYAECHGELDTDGRDAGSIAEEIDRVVSDAPIVVPMGERTYRVEIYPGVRHLAPARVRRAIKGSQVVLVTDTGAQDPWAERMQSALSEAGFNVTLVVLPAGEQHKHIGSVEQIWNAALGAKVDRDALVLAVGGGVVGDMAAFAASTILRGITLGQLPSTLLSMVDSAVGGKTGIDRAEGKNLIGTFYQPAFVLCDVETLTTLPLAERRAGLAEVVKSAWLDGEESVLLLERSAEALARGDLDAINAAVRMSVAMKARVVTEDEKETGVRATLNLGHTLGHAIEAASGYAGLRHGEAVALGMVAAFRLSQRLGVANAEQGARMQALLKQLGLPVEVDKYLDERTLAFMGSDKKRKGGKIRFIVPGTPGSTQITPLSEEEVARLVRP
ncbi:MAG TPA: 3-dehydroquinate synthase [Polyangiales bacterium]